MNAKAFRASFWLSLVLLAGLALVVARQVWTAIRREPLPAGRNLVVPAEWTPGRGMTPWRVGVAYGADGEVRFEAGEAEGFEPGCLAGLSGFDRTGAARAASHFCVGDPSGPRMAFAISRCPPGDGPGCTPRYLTFLGWMVESNGAAPTALRLRSRCPGSDGGDGCLPLPGPAATGEVRLEVEDPAAWTLRLSGTLDQPGPAGPGRRNVPGWGLATWLGGPHWMQVLQGTRDGRHRIALILERQGEGRPDAVQEAPGNGPFSVVFRPEHFGIPGTLPPRALTRDNRLHHLADVVDRLLAAGWLRYDGTTDRLVYGELPPAAGDDARELVALLEARPHLGKSLARVLNRVNDALARDDMTTASRFFEFENRYDLKPGHAVGASSGCHLERRTVRVVGLRRAAVDEDLGAILDTGPRRARGPRPRP